MHIIKSTIFVTHGNLLYGFPLKSRTVSELVNIRTQ